MKKKYVKPEIKIVMVLSEECLAAGSVQDDVSIGGAEWSGSPEITDQTLDEKKHIFEF